MDTAGKQKKPSHKQTNEDGDEQQMNKKTKVTSILLTRT